MEEIEWPWQYSFPPFFTLQLHTDTRAKQIAAWKSLVLQYVRVTKQTLIDVREAHSSPLFNNSAINRKLPSDVVLLVLEELMRSGNATPLDKQKQRWLVFWHTLEQFGDMIYKWAQDNGSIGSVFTLYELSEEFGSLDTEIILRALKTLEASGKAEIISFDDNQGVKFL